MVSVQRKAIERLYRDECTILQRMERTDPVTKLTDFAETPLVQNQPCKLSFENAPTVSGGTVAAVSQAVKLFLSPDIAIPAGCKVVVLHGGQELVYASSGQPAVFSSHQEINLNLLKEWA